ncbi:hypothetical protein QJQ45_015408 [Haematococcus lacustris]|nr:hypothetical protein QJQ45_015408 [Haematococcus lacustris]
MVELWHALKLSIGSEEQAYGDRLVRDPVQCSDAPTSTQRQKRSIALICALKYVCCCGDVLGDVQATEQRLQVVLEEHEREKQDWQQQQQDWQQQHQDWQQRQEDWQQQQQLMEKQLHDLLQQADLHAHIVAISAANELAQLKEQLNVAQARLAHQASGAEQLQQSVVKLTTAVCTADARAIAAEAHASSDAHASAALLEQEQHLNAALLEETERLHQHVAIADAATMAAMADAEDKGVRLRACMADSKQLQIECSNLMKRVARRDQALQELRAAQTAQTATGQEQEQPPAAASNCQHPSSRPHQTVQLCHTQVAAHATAAYKTSYLLRALQLLVACQLSFNKVQHAITSSLGIHLMPGQELIDRVPSGKTLKRAMDKIVETLPAYQTYVVFVVGQCEEVGVGAIAFDSKGDHMVVLTQFSRLQRLPAAALAPPPSPPPLPPPPSPTLSQDYPTATVVSTPTAGGPAAQAAGPPSSTSSRGAVASVYTAMHCVVGCVDLPKHDAKSQCQALITCLSKSGYWSAKIRILFAVCDSANANVGEQGGVVKLLSAAAISAGHQQHPIYVVHCYEHILHNAVRHLCVHFGKSACMQRQGHNSALCWLLDHVSMVFRKHPPPGSRKVEEACVTRWGTYCRIAVWVLEYYQPMLEVLQPLCLADSIAGQQKVIQCLFAELLKPVHMVQCAVLAALNRAVLEEQQLWAQSNSSRWMCHWHTHHEHIMCVLLAATVEPRMVLREAYSMGCSMVWASQARKVLRAMQRITLPVKLPTREEYSSAASARDQNTARQQRQADITNKLQHLEDTARHVYNSQQPHLPALPQKGITLNHLKQLCVRLNLATKGTKSRIQCLEAISQHQQQQHQQAPAVAALTPSKRHAPSSVMRMR